MHKRELGTATAGGPRRLCATLENRNRAAPFWAEDPIQDLKLLKIGNPFPRSRFLLIGSAFHIFHWIIQHAEIEFSTHDIRHRYPLHGPPLSWCPIHFLIHLSWQVQRQAPGPCTWNSIPIILAFNQSTAKATIHQEPSQNCCRPRILGTAKVPKTRPRLLCRKGTKSGPNCRHQN